MWACIQNEVDKRERVESDVSIALYLHPPIHPLSFILMCVPPPPAPASHHRSSLQHARGVAMDKEGKDSNGLTVVGGG